LPISPGVTPFAEHCNLSGLPIEKNDVILKKKMLSAKLRMSSEGCLMEIYVLVSFLFFAL
jgi:hypothetical protein